MKTLCGRLVSAAETNEPDDNDLDPDCNVCRRAAQKLKIKAKCQLPLGCACDACTRKMAIEHIEGDHRCGRDWSCQCAACRITRKELPTIEIDVRFDRIKQLEDRRAVIKGIKAL
nr:hypothetical protein [Kofleriaceae bacterium]